MVRVDPTEKEIEDLTRVVIHMKFMKQAFSYISYEMTRSVIFCLSYDPLNLDFIAFNINIISIRKRILDTDIVNDFTCTYQSVLRHVVI